MRELLSLLFCFFKASLNGQCNFALENLALRATTRHPEVNPKAGGNQYKGPPVLGLVISNLV